MTAPLLGTPLGLAAADLRDVRQCAAIDAFVRDTPGAELYARAGLRVAGGLIEWSRSLPRP